jgi:hypothetical protein
MRIEFDSATKTITVNGGAIALEVLEFMTNPDPRASLRFVRNGDRVIVHRTMTDEPIAFYREAP